MRLLFRRGAPIAAPAGMPLMRAAAEAGAIVMLMTGVTAMADPPPPARPAVSSAGSSVMGYQQIILPDLLVIAPKGLSATQIASIGKVSGVRNVLAADGAAIKIGTSLVNVLGVDPQKFRSWTPLATASDQGLWTALAAGRFVASQDAAARLGLRTGVSYALTGAARQNLTFGDSAPLGVSGIDVLVSNRASGALGLVRSVAGGHRRQARQLPAVVPAVRRPVLPGAVLDGARRHRPDRERRWEQHGPVQRRRAGPPGGHAVNVGHLGHHRLRRAGAAEHHGSVRRGPVGGPPPVRGWWGALSRAGLRPLLLQPRQLVCDRGARPRSAVRADLRLTAPWLDGGMPHYDAFLLVSFGGPEAPDEVMPFLENVTRGRGIPRERLAAVAEHYYAAGGVSPINQQCRDLAAAIGKDFASAGLD